MTLYVFMCTLLVVIGVACVYLTLNALAPRGELPGFVKKLWKLWLS